MKTIDERTFRMKKAYLELFYAGFSVKEIADMFGITETTVYNHLDEIAAENGFAGREEILPHPECSHSAMDTKFERLKAIKPEFYFEEYNEMKKILEERINELELLIKEAELEGRGEDVT